MSGGGTGAQLWPLVATLGAAATSTNGVQTVVQSVLQQLAGICRTSAELWEMTSEPDGAAPCWRLRASHGTQWPLQHRSGQEQPPSQIVDAATTLRTISADDPHAALAIPILAFGRLQGVLQLAAPQSHGQLARWRHDLEHFAPVLGLYLHAAELNEALGSGVLRDRSTRIANQAQLHDHLERELARARRTQRPFALLMIAPDRFDALGADLGLPLRDQLIQSLAVVLRDACRNGDIIGRYGADRFLIILPDGTSQGAQKAAQRFLAHFYRRPITLPEGTPHYLDVSIGIALFPVDGVAAGELVESAALALREAQRLGGKRAIAA